MTVEPKWLPDATTIGDLLALPEAEQERWEVCTHGDVAWHPQRTWRNWDTGAVVRARRVPQTVEIDADVLRLLAEKTHARHATIMAPCPKDGCPDLAAIHAAETALAALDADQ